VQRVNEQVDINIIVATGLYTFDEIPRFFHYRGPGTILDGPELMTEMFVNDIRHGIGGTEVRAAFLKGVEEERGLTADQARVHAAICEAHEGTRVPITVHTSAAHQTGRLTLDFYERHCVDLNDASCYSDFYSESYKTALLPRWNYTHITDDVLPALREHGVDEAQITAMLVHNPPATSPEARSEPDGGYRDFPHAQPLPASGCSG
jgi:predicted metal-dependent phosphotriesterase family hydrolase